MKKTYLVLIAALTAVGSLFAQETIYSGEIKTGFYIQQETIGEQEPVATGGMTNNDGDSGTGQGRLRLDFHFSYQNLGVRLRFQIEPNSTNLGPYYPAWSFVYAYGNLFNDQFKISMGLLGESPWGTGGPRFRGEPESREYIEYNELSGDPYNASEGLMGIRFELKPSFIPGLNIGFVLNQPDRTQLPTVTQTFGDVLEESVVGAAYENQYFAVRAGYRFDSKVDVYADSKINEGGRLTYRLEEKVLRTVVDDMRVWLNGYYYGIGGELQNIDRMDEAGNIIRKKMGGGEYFINWLYWLWDTDNFIAQFDAGFGIYKSYNNMEIRPTERDEYQSLEVRPAFYYKFFNSLLQAGLALGVGMEFGAGKTYKSSPYQYISVEPQIRLNIAGGGYIAAVYNFTDKYAWFDESKMERRGEKSVKHSVNIRAVYAF
ncbi:hypothetical protein R84B8_01085 [Treponema sp. R8-4-B8]